MLSKTKSRLSADKAGLSGKIILHTSFFFLLVTQICCAQWYQQNSGTNKNLRDVVFLNATTGIAVGDSGIILRTTNGGTLWSVVPTNVGNDLTSISFVDSQNGWVAGSNGLQTPTYLDSAVVLRTNNGGLNWFVQAKLDMYNLKDVFFVDQNTGFIVGWEGGGGNLFRTTDGGETWSDTTLPTNGIIQRVHLTDQNTGWILTSSCGSLLCWSQIYKTTDGGNFWQTQMDSLGPSLSDISFTDSQNGIAVGNTSPYFTGVIYKTTDGGETWLNNFGPPFGEFDFVDAFHISNSVIAIWGINWDWVDVFYWSTDSGVTWQLRDSMQFIYPIHINRIFFADTLNGWAVGNGGTILHTTNGGVSFVEEEQIEEMPSEFLLSNNYPNPFNPSTKIKYSVLQASNVELKVYDILGNEIETLINEEKPAGTYELTWLAENLPSGVYFYQLKAGNFIETKKMVLMK